MSKISLSHLSRGALFLAFLEASLAGFGGVLPAARRVLVDGRKWLTQDEFNELFALCQAMPGANITNLSFLFGARARGWSGAVATVAGLLGVPVVLVVVFTGLYARYGALVPVRHALAGLGAAAAGLLLGAAGRIALPNLRRGWRDVLVVALVFALAGLVRWPMIWVMALSVPLALVLAARAVRP
ncbi:chromate transporter [Acidocella sp.]|uniref:chromate transporter n=1 Tax=Acidocella sp. TaxID=50710 RepID=UPI00261342CE|nr:chromate transporter [Acidocella sp.]